jgi:uncharacterized membrane protein YgdD (TMEM256/DUF423 family)
MDKKIWIVAILGVLAVGIGAFGAHELKSHMDAGQLDTFKTGSMYHFIHLLAMLVLVGHEGKKGMNINLSFYSFLIGIVLFSGSLYILATKHLMGGDIWNIVGPLTPIGGLFFIVGWLGLTFRNEQEKKILG